MRFTFVWLGISLKSMMTKQNSWSFLQSICEKDLKKLSFRIESTEITGSKTIRNIGTMMNSVINVEAQVSSICKSECVLPASQCWAIIQYLTKYVAAQLIHSFVTSHLDYCNSLLDGVSIKSLKDSTKYNILWQGSWHSLANLIILPPLFKWSVPNLPAWSSWTLHPISISSIIIRWTFWHPEIPYFKLQW